MAARPSPFSLTMPSTTTLGGGGGGGGGSTREIDATGFGGGRRVAENSGLSRVAESSRNGCSSTGLLMATSLFAGESAAWASDAHRQSTTTVDICSIEACAIDARCETLLRLPSMRLFMWIPRVLFDIPSSGRATIKVHHAARRCKTSSMNANTPRVCVKCLRQIHEHESRRGILAMRGM
jgi:hypothetical protein